jgi:hypothetical protein
MFAGTRGWLSRGNNSFHAATGSRSARLGRGFASKGARQVGHPAQLAPRDTSQSIHRRMQLEQLHHAFVDLSKQLHPRAPVSQRSCCWFRTTHNE